MNTDKTLAEVQPGERVRLATVPYDRARDLIGDAYNAGTHGIGYGQQAMELHAAIIPAQPSQPSGLDLEAMIATCVPGGSIVDPQVVADNIRHWFAAQPSPGGQGDALIEAARIVANAAHDRALMSDILSGMRAHEAQSLKSAILALDAALAARQPVGDHLAQDRKMVSQPAASNQPSGNSGELAVDGARQPVGEPDFFMVHDEDESRWRESDEATFDSVKHHRPDDAIALYAAQPAQGVDVGAIRQALQAAEGLATICASVDGYSREEVAASGRAMRRQFADALAKVDSQAVGNG